MRKVISCEESASSSAIISAAKRKSNKRLMRDIMYYIRKLMKLAQRAQHMSVLEGSDSDEDRLISEEFEALKLEIDEFEKSL